MAAITRRVWFVPNAGALSNLVIKEEQLPPPAADEVRVKVHSIGLNFADVFSVLGLYEAAPKTNLVPGLEFAGVVETPGGGFKVGDRVLGTVRFGAYASHLNVNPLYLRHSPNGWSFEEAASFLIQSLTAIYAIRELAALKPGSTVLVQSAAGGVGLQALRILEAMPNVSVLGVVGSPSKLKFLNDTFPPAKNNEDPNAKRKNWRFISRAETGSEFAAQMSDYISSHPTLTGFDLILDSVAGPYFHPMYAAMNPAGRHVIFGAASLAPATLDLTPRLSFLSPVNLFRAIKLGYKYSMRPRVDPMKLMGDNKAVMGFNLIWLYDKAELLSGLYGELERLNLKPPHVGHRFDFEEMPAALALFQSGSTVGKVVINVKHDN
ncbi:uncharacterized protein SPPG_08631 [Spizellomyces punctatus DAOM BR117]|uniref:Enoyl reductase (ER) domain-containing protein n=1 Tax=Spizellomyces punctatus (strain DAOM BR117) TaxID=645134 RepID=A0A0L0H3I9_SPIPD|nr:uncharacterized protein SPPG_08631 [Spizellomyces punctatus DAOM BR117]KNC96035.1 hypothetical protein SPPG_08631 [Spizellomyces punctatus DAOM BR117]|eukprot:XP_016604075.1 hypothetical protein SPPG_08631 [Spizellomyces punctatus DAOM BR117]